MRSSILGSIVSAACALGASLQPVSNFGENPTNIQMYIYVPDNVASSPPIIVAVSRCTIAYTAQTLPLY